MTRRLGPLLIGALTLAAALLLAVRRRPAPVPHQPGTWRPAEP